MPFLFALPVLQFCGYNPHKFQANHSLITWVTLSISVLSMPHPLPEYLDIAMLKAL